MKVFVPVRLESASNARDGHWAQRLRRTSPQRSAATLVTKGYLRDPGEPIAQLVVTLTRVAPRALDDDNLRGALKAIRDGVAAGLRVDDASPLVRWQYEQRHGEPKQYGVEIEINSALPTGGGDVGRHLRRPKPPDVRGSGIIGPDTAGVVSLDWLPNE